MRRSVACWLLLALCGSAWPTFAEETAEREGNALAQKLEALDKVEAQLTETQQQLETAIAPRARRQLNARIHQLHEKQERLLDELEAPLLGPRVPVTNQDPTTLLEEQLKRRQQHREVILENNVDSRLPAR